MTYETMRKRPDSALPDQVKSLIYCRVSDTKQRTQGHGLESQEHRCKKYAASKNYCVEHVFHDDFTGGGDFMKRPGMMALLDYLARHPETQYTIIFDDLKRLARDTLNHWQLRYALQGLGATLECLNYNLGDSPEDEFMETIFAAQGQLERKQNRRQTVQKMIARMESGYWVFHAPIGYKYEKIKGGNKVLLRDEPLALIITEALEGFASGRFQSKAEVKYFLESFPEYPKGRNGRIHNQRIEDLLTRVLYAGYLESESWGIGLTKAQHEPLVSFETYHKIQERLKGKAHAPARKNINADFPLRGFVSCECGKPLTAGWTKGRHAHYPYYYCQAKGCDHYGKSIKRDVIEGEFEKLLRHMTPSGELVAIASRMFEKLWNHRRDYSEARRQSLEEELIKAQRQIDSLLERVLDAELPSVIKAYEKKIKSFEETKVLTEEKIAACGRPMRGYDETYRTAIEFLGKPYKLWDSQRLEDKRTVLKLAFADRLTYVRKKGYRTAKTTLPFKVLVGLSDQNVKMVPVRGVEPPTFALRMRCSTN